MRFIEVFLGSKVLLKVVGLGIICFLAGIITLAGLYLAREVSCFLELDSKAVPGCFTDFKAVLTTRSLLVLFSAVRDESLFGFRLAKLWFVTEFAGEGLRWAKPRTGIVGTIRGASRAGDLN
jgi:hypothetical protein